MKFVYFGYDFMLGSVRRLIDEGHELLGVFTFECDNVFNFNTATLELAKSLRVPVILSPPQDIHIESFLRDGAECFLAAGYPFKIPPIAEDKAYGINVHPSHLPKGRGLMPTPYILTGSPEAAGVTVHKLAPRFDAGDILYQEAIDISDRETVESYSARIALMVPGILAMLLGDLPLYWKNAKEQDPAQATHFPVPDDTMRLLKWDGPVSVIDRTSRAFGRFGSIAYFDSRYWVVYDLDVWTESHRHVPGAIACRLSREIIVAARDGYVCLKDFQEIQG
jgi:methionyl-tRNA formyltransferase